MLAEPDEVEPELVGEHRLVDNVADHLRMREHAAGGILGDVAKGIQSEFERCGHRSDLCREDRPHLVDQSRATRRHPEMLGFHLCVLPPHPAHPRPDVDLRSL